MNLLLPVPMPRELVDGVLLRRVPRGTLVFPHLEADDGVLELLRRWRHLPLVLEHPNHVGSRHNKNAEDADPDDERRQVLGLGNAFDGGWHTWPLHPNRWSRGGRRGAPWVAATEPPFAPAMLSVERPAYTKSSGASEPDC